VSSCWTCTSEFFDDGTLLLREVGQEQSLAAQMVDFWKNLLDRYPEIWALKMGSPKTITPGGNS